MYSIVPITIDVKFYLLCELADIYGICDRTMLHWIKVHCPEIGQKSGRFFIIPQVETIFKNCGVPHYIVVEGKHVLVKAYSLKELAGLYGVSEETMTNLINVYCTGIGKKAGNFYTVNQVSYIYETLGVRHFITLGKQGPFDGLANASPLAILMPFYLLTGKTAQTDMWDYCLDQIMPLLSDNPFC